MSGADEKEPGYRESQDEAEREYVHRRMVAEYGIQSGIQDGDRGDAFQEKIEIFRHFPSPFFYSL